MAGRVRVPPAASAGTLTCPRASRRARPGQGVPPTAKARLAAVLLDHAARGPPRPLDGRPRARRGRARCRCFVVCDDARGRRVGRGTRAPRCCGARAAASTAPSTTAWPLARRPGFDHVVVAHADLPLATGSPTLARPGRVTLVPDRRDDGTNVLCAARRLARFAFALRRRLVPPPPRRGPPPRARRVRGACATPRSRSTSTLPDRPRPTRCVQEVLPVAANEPGQPALTTARADRSTTSPVAARRRWRSAPTPTTSSSAAAATLAKWAAAGCVVHHLVLHRRLEGHLGPRRRHGRAGRARARTSNARRPRRSAATRRGACSSARSTASSRATAALRGEVARVIRELRPDVVLGHDPWKRYRLHPDHRHAGLLACDGIVAARDPHFFPEHGLAASPARRRCCCGRPTSPTTSRT